MIKKLVARVFEDVGGYFVCGEDLGFFDARGTPAKNKAEALRRAVMCGYTHAVGSGTYWDGVRRIPKKFIGGW